MWTCEHCGCQAIAASVAGCPQCFTPRSAEKPAAVPEVDDMATAAAAGLGLVQPGPEGM